MAHTRARTVPEAGGKSPAEKNKRDSGPRWHLRRVEAAMAGTYTGSISEAIQIFVPGWIAKACTQTQAECPCEPYCSSTAPVVWRCRYLEGGNVP